MTAGLHSPGRLAQVACLLEATARKPGNVHRFLDFTDTHYLDFALSALAIGPALDGASLQGVGRSVLDAVRATRALVATNTNLGIVLLLAPLAAVPVDRPLRAGVESVLSATTIGDARLVYEAVRLALPGGMGKVPDQDLSEEPTGTLREVMALASGRDLIARQYVNGFADVFERALASLDRAVGAGRALESAIVTAHLILLAEVPDTLIARKCGVAVALDASRRASAVLAAGWPDSPAGVRLCDEFDRWLRADGNARNPGATADLVTAALFAGLRAGTIGLPLTLSAWGPSAGLPRPGMET